MPSGLLKFSSSRYRFFKKYSVSGGVLLRHYIVKDKEEVAFKRAL